jgi:hypothetical protein
MAALAARVPGYLLAAAQWDMRHDPAQLEC